VESAGVKQDVSIYGHGHQEAMPEFFGCKFKLNRIMALFSWLAPSQPAVLFSHTSSAPATSYQPASSIFLSQ
jgi:hypothetical protein